LFLGSGVLCRKFLQPALLGEARNVVMKDFKFPVGTTVQVSRKSLSGHAAVGAFKVLARYPSDTSGPMYRVRSVLGSEERMVPEHELSSSAQMAEADAAWKSPKSGRR